jgi:hypothetical protein
MYGAGGASPLTSPAPHAGSIGSSNLPLSLVTTTFGPRYRWHPDRRVSLYVQGLVGEANGFRSIFPATAGSQPDANGFAAQFDGGVDYRLSDRFAMRVLDAAGRGHNCQTVQIMCKIPFASAPASCCASRIKDCEASEPAAASPVDIRSKWRTFQGIRNVISACWEVSNDTTMFLVINGQSGHYRQGCLCVAQAVIKLRNSIEVRNHQI